MKVTCRGSTVRGHAAEADKLLIKPRRVGQVGAGTPRNRSNEGHAASGGQYSRESPRAAGTSLAQPSQAVTDTHSVLGETRAAEPLQTVEIITGRGPSADSHVVSLDPSHVDQTYGFRPTALILLQYCIQGFNDLFTWPIASYRPPRSYIEVTFADEAAAYSSRPERERTPSPTDTGTRSKRSGTTRSRPNGHSTRAC